MKQLSLTFLTYNRLGIVARCLRSFLPAIQAGHQIVILDNASTDGTAEWLLKLARQYPNITVELSAVNLGVAGGRSRLLELATGEIVAFLDSDTKIVKPDFLERMITPLQNPNVGVTGAAGWRVQPDWSIQPAGNVTGQVDILSGYCHFYRRDVIERGLHFDLAFNGIGAEDDDLCCQVMAMGLQVWQVADCGLFHVFSGTWNTPGGYSRGRQLHRHKWQAQELMQFQRDKVTA
jgi:GT2 family glycosyltransferase